jgi:hypothetical protein
MIQRASAHFDQDFVVFDLRIGDLGILQNLRPAVLREDYCFHFVVLFCPPKLRNQNCWRAVARL